MDGNNLNQPGNIQNQNNAENRNNNVENQNNIQPNPVANDLNSINNVAEEEQIKNRPVMTNEEISRQAEIATAAMDEWQSGREKKLPARFFLRYNILGLFLCETCWRGLWILTRY